MLLPAEILIDKGENILNLYQVPIMVGRLREAFAHENGEIWKSIFFARLNSLYGMMMFTHSVRSNSFATPWTVAHQAPPLPLGFRRQEHWSGLSFPSLGDLPHSGIESASLALAGRVFTTKPPGKPLGYDIQSLISRNSSRRSGQSGKSVSRRVWCGDCAVPGWGHVCFSLGLLCHHSNLCLHSLHYHPCIFMSTLFMGVFLYLIN